ncbi:uncharacterized protein PpBr36_10744 [Pyricularia pennisetigena]|uniref:uncharacterized protein n=1 Tax=Pyricularia pennisetigena TaxID=1578925 RepID=UPI001154F1CD|nr:uncharacterized protein PpBr36_10744 [Pyricularia pennisetigena]TLS21008.1 hypothetical protein PpBr36_10744 [Pyricularia pennisetigena]
MKFQNIATTSLIGGGICFGIVNGLDGWLSNTIKVIGPNTTEFKEASDRWDTYQAPNIELIVEPGQEDDVPKIVKYCNENGIDFLAYSGGHGSSTTLGSFKGIQINLTRLRNISIDPSGKTAWVQGGSTGGSVINHLWDHGYVTPTGTIGCVGYMGLALGGGHGRLEGLYGLVSDNILQFDLVTANGTTIRVNKTKHSDLYWAMKGAGHNFGIVTRVQVKIYPRGPEMWYHRAYTWRGDKLDAVFDALNNLHGNGTTPVAMAVNTGTFLMMPHITKEEPVILWLFEYRGSAEKAKRLLAPFDSIEAVAVDSRESIYPQLADQPSLCTGAERIITTAGLRTYNLTAERQIWDGFKRRVAKNPKLTAKTIIIHEGYATEGVEKMDPASSAYPFRGDRHLMQFQGTLEDSSLAAEMWEWANEVRHQWNAGQPQRTPSAYVNYANGHERKEDCYGHQPWRLAKLRDLKARYDPANRFRFYNPII